MKKRHITLLVFLVVLGAVYVALNRFISKKGYDGLVDFIPSVISNSLNSSPALDTLYLKIDKDSYEKFSAIRDKALETGIIVNPEDPWVNGKVKYKGDKVKVALRLKGKMTDHVKGDKWSFRVKTKKGKLINKMHRFSLQHPGTRNYLYEWVHQQLAREQGIMALNYQFVHVYLNKKDLGIYALEENFDKELALNNKRALGPIFRFDPDAYWEYRLLGTQGFSLKPEYTTFQSSFVDPMRSYMIEDSVQTDYFEEALFLMNSFREGKIKASDALDIDLFAKKYAILDLIGGYHSVDWSDVKFYYDPIQKHIEPIAYESFSVRKIHDLIGFDKFRREEAYHDDFHTVLFSDSAFYSRYIHYLTEFSKETFMPSFLERNDSALQANLQVLNTEFPYKRFEPDTYAYNSKVIRKLLDPKYPVHAFLKRSKEGTFIQVGNVSSFPLVIESVEIGDSQQKINTSTLDPKLSKGFINYRSIRIACPDSLVPSKIYCKILGQEQTREIEIFAYEHPPTASYINEISDYHNYLGVLYEQKGDSLIFIPGKHEVTTDIRFPKHLNLIAFAPLRLNFKNNAHFIVEGQLSFKGQAEDPILMEHPTFIFMHAKGTIRLENIVFSTMKINDKPMYSYPAAIVVDGSKLKVKNCVFKNADQPVIYGTNADIEMTSSTFYQVEKAVKVDFSQLTFNNVNFSVISRNAISLDASQLKAKGLFVKDCGAKALNMEKWSSLELINSEISNSKLALSIKSGSSLTGKNIMFSQNELDLEIKSKDGYGISKVSLSVIENAKKLVIEKDDESELRVD